MLKTKNNEDRIINIGDVIGTLSKKPVSIKLADYQELVDGLANKNPLMVNFDNQAFYNYGYVSSFINKVFGDVLTIIDAVSDDTPKYKATKDLIRKAFKERQEQIMDSSCYPHVVDVNKVIRDFEN